MIKLDRKYFIYEYERHISIILKYYRKDKIRESIDNAFNKVILTEMRY